MTTVTNQLPEDTQPAPADMPRFSINDLKSLQEIVKVATERGAFRAHELSAIGSVYDRLSAFLAAGEIASQSDEETAEETAEEQTGE